MNPDPENQQSELQRMLALKRHETPPPRFFQGLSERVIEGLNAPDPPQPRTLRHRLGLDIDSKPVLVCASGVAVCGLLAIGMIASLRVEPPKPAAPAAEDRTLLVVSPPPSTLPAPSDAENLAATPGPAQELGGPVLVPGTSPFSSVRLQPNQAALRKPQENAPPK